MSLQIRKHINQFYKNKTSNDGFQAECSKCKTEIYFLNKD
jgi:hypothetical protein